MLPYLLIKRLINLMANPAHVYIDIEILIDTQL